MMYASIVLYSSKIKVTGNVQWGNFVGQTRQTIRVEERGGITDRADCFLFFSRITSIHPIVDGCGLGVSG